MLNPAPNELPTLLIRLIYRTAKFYAYKLADDQWR